LRKDRIPPGIPEYFVSIAGYKTIKNLFPLYTIILTAAYGIFTEVGVTKEFISKTIPPHPCPLPPGERGLIISPTLTGGDEGEGDTCDFTNTVLVEGIGLMSDELQTIGIFSGQWLALFSFHCIRLYIFLRYP